MLDFLKVKGVPGANHPTQFSIRCPGCGALANLAPLRGPNGDVTDHNIDKKYVGFRVCPNPACQTFVFVVFDGDRRLAASWPPVRLPFDRTNLPASIASHFDEAMTCHAHGCHVAAAIMLRRVLEELCKDKDATGPNLKARLEALGKTIVLPQDLVKAFDALRLLGNDAAHVEAATYNKIGAEEIEAAAELTREILRAVYQYSALLTRLSALRKQSV